uniref:Carboxylesterase n=1 Tax=Paulinella micropora TaxID=1928728 RepID=A0A385I1B3_9EUKA|nr:carboxylesterase [Paulinella micropora]AXY63727.1 carboxylesterase [Paulinella micropora]
MIHLSNLLLAAVMWVQVPQWSADWSKCAVDLPDVNCHWYVVAPDNTFGEGFDWATSPWFDANGLQDISALHETLTNLQNS